MTTPEKMDDRIESTPTAEQAAPLSFARAAPVAARSADSSGLGLQHRARAALRRRTRSRGASRSPERSRAPPRGVARTRFGIQDGQPVQVIAPELVIALAVEDLQHLSAHERESEAHRLAQGLTEAPFDLERGPLLRARLLRLSPSLHWLVLSMHHIVTDAWSSGVPHARAHDTVQLVPPRRDVAACCVARAIRRLCTVAAAVAPGHGARRSARLLARSALGEYPRWNCRRIGRAPRPPASAGGLVRFVVARRPDAIAQGIEPARGA